MNEGMFAEQIAEQQSAAMMRTAAVGLADCANCAGPQPAPPSYTMRDKIHRNQERIEHLENEACELRQALTEIAQILVTQIGVTVNK